MELEPVVGSDVGRTAAVVTCWGAAVGATVSGTVVGALGWVGGTVGGAGSTVVVVGGTVVVVGGTVVVVGGGHRSSGMVVVTVCDDWNWSSNVTVAVNDTVVPTGSVVWAVTVFAVCDDDETDRLNDTVWMAWSPAFSDTNVHVTWAVSPTHVACAEPPVRSWADAGPASMPMPTAPIPAANRPPASSGRTLTVVFPFEVW